MFDTTPTRPATLVNCCPIVELRQYTCRTGRRDALIDLFEREFVDAHETVGIRQLGQFRDLDDPDNFVWIRGFPEPEARRRTLPAFYESAAWEAHKEQALATLEGWDNARQLRRTHAASGFALPSAPLSADVDPSPTALVVATLYSLADPIDDHFIRLFEDGVRPAVTETGASSIASFQTDHSENPFPRLPLRTGENMFVWFTTFATVEEHREHVARLGESSDWNDEVAPELARRLGARPQMLRLEPTPRSLIGRS
jgi:hypothetical protein